MFGSKNYSFWQQIMKKKIAANIFYFGSESFFFQTKTTDLLRNGQSSAFGAISWIIRSMQNKLLVLASFWTARNFLRSICIYNSKSSRQSNQNEIIGIFSLGCWFFRKNLSRFSIIFIDFFSAKLCPNELQTADFFSTTLHPNIYALISIWLAVHYECTWLGIAKWIGGFCLKKKNILCKTKIYSLPRKEYLQPKK